MKKIIFSCFFVFFQILTAQYQNEGTQLDAAYQPVYYRLEMNLNPNQTNFSGKTTVHFNTSADLSEFKINAKPNLTIESVVYHQNNLTNYSRSGEVLTIQLPGIIESEKLDSISISFSGNSDSSAGLSRGYHDGIPVIETLSEPWLASSWWVCKDDLLNKVNKTDVYIQHPEGLKAASNGSLKSVTPAGNNTVITHWQHNYPIPAYLIGVALTNYTEYNHTVEVGGQSVPIINYLYPETLSDWTSQLDQVPSHILFLSEKYGDYPYKDEKYGHAQWNRNGGMEHSTMSFMGKFTFNLIVHELAHQWFGNKVTCATWHDIWLNEGFADYSVGLKNEYDFGEQSFKNWKGSRIDFITSQNWGSVYNPDANNSGRIFDSRLTYNKGSMVVHLIRYILNNDELFFQSLRDYLENPEFAWGYADTEDFKASLEASTGLNWDDFFNDWIYGEGHPVFDITISNFPNNQVRVHFQQSGSHSSVSYFHTPFEIEFRGSGGQKSTRRFYLDSPEQDFWVDDLGFQVNSFDLNPGNDIICKINSWELATAEESLTAEFEVYPNPVREILNIKSNQTLKEIRIFDLSGKEVYSKSDLNLQKTEIATDGLEKGVYLLQLKTDKALKTIRILKN